MRRASHDGSQKWTLGTKNRTGIQKGPGIRNGLQEPKIRWGARKGPVRSGSLESKFDESQKGSYGIRNERRKSSFTGFSKLVGNDILLR
jgi:hypothetical protein